MTVITINGQRYEVPDGAQIEIVDNSIIIKGVEQSQKVSGKVEIIVISGNVGSVYCDASVKIDGGVQGNVTGTTVNCGSVGGDVIAGANVNCGDVKGSVNADNNVNAGKISGSVTAGGNIIGLRG